jgi:hypothetical protein
MKGEALALSGCGGVHFYDEHGNLRSLTER